MRISKANHSDVYILHVRGRKQIKKLFDYLYLDANLFLSRKHMRYKKMCYEANNTVAA